MKKLLISALALFVVGSVAAQEGLGETYNKAVAAYNSKDFASAQLYTYLPLVPKRDFLIS